MPPVWGGGSRVGCPHFLLRPSAPAPAAAPSPPPHLFPKPPGDVGHPGRGCVIGLELRSTLLAHHHPASLPFMRNLGGATSSPTSCLPSSPCPGGGDLSPRWGCPQELTAGCWGGFSPCATAPWGAHAGIWGTGTPITPPFFAPGRHRGGWRRVRPPGGAGRSSGAPAPCGSPPPVPGSHTWERGRPAAGAERCPNAVQMERLQPSRSYRGVVLGPRGTSS